jgi:serine phosphatase RsbU (regulator of sigma subunit)
MAVLQQVFGDPPLPSCSVSGEVTTIGRHEDCNVIVPLPAVSRFHARMSCEDNRFFVEDLGSRNGTHVNGRQVLERTPLSDGDQLEFSALAYRFATQDSPSEASGIRGVRAKVMSGADAASDNGDSIRRRIVSHGDSISSDDLGSDPVREEQVVSRMLVTNVGAWPVLTGATQKLNHVLRMINGLRRAIGYDDVISRALQNLFDIFRSAERIAVVIKRQYSNDIRVAAAVSRQADEEVQICLPVVRSCMQNAEAMLYVDHWKGSAADGSELGNGSMRSIICVPLVGLAEHSIGAIQIDCQNARRPLNKEHFEQLIVVCQVISFALEQATAAEVEITRTVVETNVASAERFRSQLAPMDPPALNGYRVAHELIPAAETATDLIDYLVLPDGSVACLLLDATGREPGASDLLAWLARQLIVAVAETGSKLEAIRQTEQVLSGRLGQLPTVTSVAVMLLDPQCCSVTMSVAGHCSLWRIDGQQVTELDSPEVIGSPLNHGRQVHLQSEYQLNDNDIILVFSGGITKLTSPSGSTLSRSETVKLIEEAATADRTVFESRLRHLLNSYRGDAPLVDDVTFMVIHRAGMSETILSPAASAVDSETRHV